MTSLRHLAPTALIVLSISLVSLLAVRTVRAQDLDAEIPSPPIDLAITTDHETADAKLEGASTSTTEDDDMRGPLLVGAAFTTGFFAFNLALELSDIPAFGPRPIITASLAVTSLGFLASHVGAFALLDPGVYGDPRQRSFFAGLSLLGTSLGMIGISVPSCFAVTSAPLDGDPEDIAVVSPFFLGAMGLVGVVAGAVMMNDALSLPNDVSIDLAASPDGAMLSISGTF